MCRSAENTNTQKVNGRMLLYLKQRHYKNASIIDVWSSALRRCARVHITSQASFGSTNKSVAQVPQRGSTSLQFGSQSHNGDSFFGDVKASGLRRDPSYDIVEGGAANPAVNGGFKQNQLIANA